MATQIGNKIRELRNENNILLRQLASSLDLDPSVISKVERGDRMIKKDYIPKLAEVLDADEDELISLWLSDQIYEIIKGEKQALNALKLVINKIAGDINKNK